MNELKASLLAERESILKELKSVESLLQARFRWIDEESPSRRRFSSKREIPAKVSESNDNEHEIDTPLAYASEAREWLGTLDVDRRFTVNTFKKHLEGKYGAEAVNMSSLRGPFSRLEANGAIIAIRKGGGRTPTLFKKGDELDM